MWKRGLTKGTFNKFFSHLDLSFSDHGILRVLWTSLANLPGEMYRCNQPSPNQIERYKKNLNIKTIINLRGERHCSSYYLEKECCEKNNTKLCNFPITSRDLPSRKTINRFLILLDNIEYPAIMHCKSGADRAGIAASLYLMYKYKYNIVDAIKQLSFRHLHIKYAKTGILDYLLESAIKKGKVSSEDFFSWINTTYNKDELKKSFKVYSLFSFLVERVLNRE